jgi:Swt1-like HEPN
MSKIEDELRKQSQLARAMARAVDLAEHAGLSASLTKALPIQSFLMKDLEVSNSIHKMFEARLPFDQQFRVPEVLSTALAWQESTGVSAVLESMRAHDFLTHASIGPIADLKNLGFFDIPKNYLQEFGINLKVLASFDARFCIPQATEMARLAGMFSASATARTLAALAEPSLSVRRAMERMTTPWLEIANPAISASAFGAIQEMGSALSRIQAYDADLSAALRAELGDWRQPIEWPAAIFTDLEARSNFYASLGVNTALTNMPMPAFRETLGIANLLEPPPTLIDRYEEIEPEESSYNEETGFVRTNEAHDRLQRLESQLRKFIDEVMTLEAGPNWPKHRLHPDLLAAWREKKQRAQQQADTDLPLIAYADFTDYERVICKRDNWKIFETYFRRPESVRESFQRLYPIRLDTMHSRVITQDDELFLAVECKRLMNAIGKRRSS